MEKLHKRKKTSVGDTIFVICNTLFMILFVLITLYPILNTADRCLCFCGKNSSWNFAGPDCQCNSGIYRQQKTFPVQKTVVTILGYYHVCKRWHDSNIPAVQKPGNDKQFLGLCNSWYVQCL